MKVLERRERIEAAAGQAVFVVHDDPDRIRAGVLDGLDVPFPVLVDLERRAYRDWGLGRASVLAVYGSPEVWGEYARMLLGGERLRRPGRDTLQLGGDFVIDGEGRLAYSRPQRRDDRPPVAEVVRALEAAAA